MLLLSESSSSQYCKNIRGTTRSRNFTCDGICTAWFFTKLSENSQRNITRSTIGEICPGHCNGKTILILLISLVNVTNVENLLTGHGCKIFLCIGRYLLFQIPLFNIIVNMYHIFIYNWRWLIHNSIW